MKILIDDGHGIETPGKRSPDEGSGNKPETGSSPPASWTASSPSASIPNSSSRRKGTSPCPSAAAVAAGTMPPAGAPTPQGATPTPTPWPPASNTAVQATLPGKRLRTDYTDGAPDLEADFYILRHTRNDGSRTKKPAKIAFSRPLVSGSG